jgi:hypothetical protein
MGIYRYTLRKKKVNLILADGSKAQANLCSYAYKLSHTFWKEGWRARMEAKAEACAARAFEAYEGGYVIDCDPEDLQDAAVYVKMTHPAYNDCYPFPAELVGFVNIVDNHRHLVQQTRWNQFTSGGKQFESRSVLQDGKVIYEKKELTCVST